MKYKILPLIWLIVLISSCYKKQTLNQYHTQKVVLVSIDGARWSETWGDSIRQFIPYRNKQLLQQGILIKTCYNQGFTYTTAGHTAMLTGVYQGLDNTGKETPFMPNIFQYYRWAKNKAANQTWIISSKDKIAALANCLQTQWQGQYLPMTDCGISGLGSGYREDSITFQNAIQIFKNHQPNLSLVHFRNPDFTAHQNDWEGYLNAIKNTDSLVYELWQYLQTDSNYRGVTTMIITNDHGRHLNGVADGFVSHGDGCEGCRHVELMILGPDVAHNEEVIIPSETIDIPTTIAELLHVPFYTGKGKVLSVLKPTQ